MNHLVPNAIFDQHIILLGKTRSGKSSVMRLMIEHLLDRKEPVCIVDPKGDWWGLKSSADGKHPGYSVVIFGGEHGDVPLNSKSGATVAELAATENRPCIIDLGGWMPGARTEFWIDFASKFFILTRGRRWLAIDEVHNFCPKGKIMDPNAGKMLHWSNRLASEGLGKGVALIAASQRPQKVHNDFLTSCETLIAMRVIHKADRGAIEDWIDGCGDPEKGPEVVNTLAAMKRGEAWVWSPEAGFGPKRIHFPMFNTYDSFKPQDVQHPKQLKGWADVDLTEVKKRLDTVVKEAEANDPAKLKARIRELEQQMSRKPDTAMSRKVDISWLESCVKGSIRPYRALLSDLRRDLAFTLKAATSDAERLDRMIATIDMKLEEKLPASENPQKEIMKTMVRDGFPIPPPRPNMRPGISTPPESVNGKLRAGAERMLAALAQWHPNGMASGQMRSHAGLKKSGTFSTYMSDLRNGGYIEERNGEIFATDSGLEYCKHVPAAPTTTEEVLAIWNPKLRDGARRMLAVLVDAGGFSLTREELGEKAGLAKSGTFSTYLSDLRTARLVLVSEGHVRANKETLFL